MRLEDRAVNVLRLRMAGVGTVDGFTALEMSVYLDMIPDCALMLLRQLVGKTWKFEDEPGEYRLSHCCKQNLVERFDWIKVG